MFLSNKPGVPPGINLLQKPSQKLSRPSGNLANPVIFSRKPGKDKDSTGSVTEGCLNGGEMDFDRLKGVGRLMEVKTIQKAII